MRKTFFEQLHHWMGLNTDIWAITGDLGYIGFDAIRRDYPERFINAGAAEQSMMDIAVGLAIQGKIPFVYSITPFLLWRPAESIRLYINHEKLPIKLVGSGRDHDYEHDGFSHDASDDEDLLSIFPYIRVMKPNNTDAVADCVKRMVENKRAYYLNLSR